MNIDLNLIDKKAEERKAAMVDFANSVNKIGQYLDALNGLKDVLKEAMDKHDKLDSEAKQCLPSQVPIVWMERPMDHLLHLIGDNERCYIGLTHLVNGVLK